MDQQKKKWVQTKGISINYVWTLVTKNGSLITTNIPMEEINNRGKCPTHGRFQQHLNNFSVSF
jgi:hypothetical protein